MNQSEKEDQVWKLLEHARKVEPGPYFTRRVLREVTLEGGRSTGPAEWLRRISEAFSPRIALPGLAVVAVAILAVFVSRPGKPEVQGVNPALVLQIGPEEFNPAAEMEAVHYLGQLMAVADPGQLTDDALADLFF